MKTHQQPTEVVNRPFAKVVKVVSFLEFTSRVQIREVRHVRQNVNINWGEISEALVDVFVVEWNGLSRDELDIERRFDDSPCPSDLDQLTFTRDAGTVNHDCREQSEQAKEKRAKELHHANQV